VDEPLKRGREQHPRALIGVPFLSPPIPQTQANARIGDERKGIAPALYFFLSSLFLFFFFFFLPGSIGSGATPEQPVEQTAAGKPRAIVARQRFVVDEWKCLGHGRRFCRSASSAAFDSVAEPKTPRRLRRLRQLG